MTSTNTITNPFNISEIFLKYYDSSAVFFVVYGWILVEPIFEIASFFLHDESTTNTGKIRTHHKLSPMGFMTAYHYSSLNELG